MKFDNDAERARVADALKDLTDLQDVTATGQITPAHVHHWKSAYDRLASVLFPVEVSSLGYDPDFAPKPPVTQVGMGTEKEK